MKEPWQFDPAKHKTSADVYHVREADGFSWGYFFVHENGILTAYTDYGNYAYCWSASGRSVSIKEFLVRIHADYLLGKIARRDTLDEERTQHVFAEHLLYLRRQNTITKEQAREMYGEMRETEPRDLVQWGMDQGGYFSDCWEWARYDYSASAKAFAERLWPLFVQVLKDELATAKGGAA